MALPFMLVRASTKTFVSRIYIRQPSPKNREKIFVTQNIRQQGHSLAEVSLYLGSFIYICSEYSSVLTVAVCHHFSTQSQVQLIYLSCGGTSPCHQPSRCDLFHLAMNVFATQTYSLADRLTSLVSFSASLDTGLYSYVDQSFPFQLCPLKSPKTFMNNMSLFNSFCSNLPLSDIFASYDLIVTFTRICDVFTLLQLD